MKDTRMIFGFCLLAIYTGLAVALAIGHVEEATSYGLHEILAALSGLGTAWAVWAFKSGDGKPPAE